MEERAVRKLAAFAGIAFAVLLVISIVLTIPAPMPDKSTAKIVKWFADHRGLIFTASAVGSLSSVAFLWFLGYLHHVLSRVAVGGRALASIVLASGIFTVTIATLTALPYAALSVVAVGPSGSADEALVHMLDVLNGFVITLIGFGLAILLVSLGMLLAQGVLRPRWASWAAYAGAAANLIGGVSGFYVSKTGKGNPLGLLGLIGVVFFLVTVVAISIDWLSPPAALE